MTTLAVAVIIKYKQLHSCLTALHRSYNDSAAYGIHVLKLLCGCNTKSILVLTPCNISCLEITVKFISCFRSLFSQNMTICIASILHLTIMAMACLVK